jgi:prepilin-type processing-associated H-X9-DG protein
VDENGNAAFGSVVDDGRWVPPDNILTGRHRIASGSRVPRTTFMKNGRATVLFADFHVQSVAPEVGLSRDYYDALY